MDQHSSGLRSKGAAAPYSRKNETQNSLKGTSYLPDATQGHQINIQAPAPIIHTQGLNSQEPSTSIPHRRSHQLNRKQKRSSVDVPPSITCSPEASIESFESFVGDSKDSLRGHLHKSLSSQSAAGSFSKLASLSTAMGSNRTQSKHWPLLRMGWMLLLEAKKISQYLSLVLTVVGMLMLNFIAFWQPWIRFQVPLVPSGDPTGPKTIPIDTTFFMGCPDISCMNDYDLLDLAWACLLISGIMSFCVCMGLIRTIFFSSTNTPSMDFFLFICSLMTGMYYDASHGCPL
ncbi:uncharacterized protein LOC119086825 isoform X1 [Peromyscus leucopus]|uniref:uncharacterized protein LOC119086825 isoform X1 n=1 Tax=Peromyscus leucopus TaxID=10041 RepID=UPI0018853F54|nr:uncharacterized protein LOC119086825 isoform X1 [Peromyscus leucopus]